MTAFEIYSPGKAVISPDIVIGEKLDPETVTKVFTAFTDCCKICFNRRDPDTVIISAETMDYTLSFTCHNGRLYSAIITRDGLL